MTNDFKFTALRPRSDRFYWALFQAIDERIQHRIAMEEIIEQTHLGLFGWLFKNQTKIENMIVILLTNVLVASLILVFL